MDVSATHGNRTLLNRFFCQKKIISLHLTVMVNHVIQFDFIIKKQRDETKIKWKLIQPFNTNQSINSIFLIRNHLPILGRVMHTGRFGYSFCTRISAKRFEYVYVFGCGFNRSGVTFSNALTSIHSAKRIKSSGWCSQSYTFSSNTSWSQ